MGFYDTLDLLPGEGEEKTKKYKRVRKTCEICGENAHYRQGFLWENFRRNPASSGFGRDDCSWCEDKCIFLCKAHQNKYEIPKGMVGGSTYPATETLAHMFLYWEEID